MLLQLTPAQALIGGVSLGLLSVGRLLINGKIFGLSGTIRGLLRGGYDRSRLAVVLGLVAGGALLRQVAPGSFGGSLPASFSIGRAVLAGALVGSGAVLANGCTSGHGICGNARLSPRSMAFTLLIMASGALSARLAGTAAALGVTGVEVAIALPPTSELVKGLALPGVTLAALGVTAQVLHAQQPARPGAKTAAAETVADALQGLLFSLALGYAGMTDPRKVAGFLSPSPAGWDYSLAFVMGGAVLTSLPSFRAAFKREKRGEWPKIALTGRRLPGLGGRVDARLVIGALLFGAGWGAGGLCPGPGIVGAATLSPQVLAFDAAMLAAMYLVP